MMSQDKAYEAGYRRGRAWLGPRGDGGLGGLSTTFVDREAQRFAAGFEFSQLLDGPTAEELAVYHAFWRGFVDGREAAAHEL